DPVAWFGCAVDSAGASQVRSTPARSFSLTGDTGIMDRQGWLHFSTRDDGAILTYGYRIGPAEVEAVLNEHPAVDECGVYPVPDELAGQLIGARVVTASGASGSKELVEALKTWSSEEHTSEL